MGLERPIKFYETKNEYKNAKKMLEYLYYSEDIIYLQRKYNFYKKEME